MIITVGFKKRIYFQWTWTHPYLTSWPSAVFYSLDGLLSIWYIPHFHSQLYSIVVKFQEHEYSYLILKCVYCVLCTGVCWFSPFLDMALSSLFLTYDCFFCILCLSYSNFKKWNLVPSLYPLNHLKKKHYLEHLFWPERKKKWRS